MPPNTIGSWYTINLPVQYNARKRGLGATVDITSSKTNLPIPVKPAKYDHHVILNSVDGIKVSILSLSCFKEVKDYYLLAFFRREVLVIIPIAIKV